MATIALAIFDWSDGDVKQGRTYRREPGQHQWHAIERSPLFVAGPTAAMTALLANFSWEVMRANINSLTQSFTLIDVSTTASAIGLLAGLMLARAQFVRTIRPIFGFSWTAVDKSSIGPTSRWMLHFYNGGPGYSEILSVDYNVSFNGQFRSDAWVKYKAVMDLLDASGVAAGVDMPWLGGAPLVPQARATDGHRLGTFDFTALAALEDFNVRIVARDSAGDRHILTINALAYLPLAAVKVVKSRRPGVP